MSFSPEQQRAMKQVAEWLTNSDQQVFRLFGYAGTGKTTLARYFAEGVEGTVLFGAFTGKASHVLRQKGCPGATTLHSLIYHTKEKGKVKLKELELQLLTLVGELQAEGIEPAGHRRVKDLQAMINEEKRALSRPSFTLNSDSEVKYAKLLVVDECSMVDEVMGNDVLSFGTKVLVLGDPAQLPPVGGGGFFTEGQPDIMLTEIHRQARDNPIIELATRARNQQLISYGTYGTCIVKNAAGANDALAADQILVGRNRTRHSSNNRMRQLRGVAEPLPVSGDRLVCLRNNHDRGLLNGAIWRVDKAGESFGERIILGVTPEEGGDLVEVEAHTHYFLGQEKNLPWWERKEAEEFDYGYALTVHKAQGSQWDNVLLFDESDAFRKDGWRWLYTGITRAAESLTIIRS